MHSLHSSLAVAAILFAGACSSASVRSTSSTLLEATDAGTYAWVQESAPFGEEVSPFADPQLIQEFREAFDRTLAESGYVLVPLDDARLEATLEIGLSTRLVENDPHFAFWAWERIERGHLYFAFLDPRDGSTVWSSMAARDLRTTERGVGFAERQFVGTEEVRDWRPASMTRGALGDLPKR